LKASFTHCSRKSVWGKRSHVSNFLLKAASHAGLCCVVLHAEIDITLPARIRADSTNGVRFTVMSPSFATAALASVVRKQHTSAGENLQQALFVLNGLYAQDLSQVAIAQHFFFHVAQSPQCTMG
jgi:hypothetical protein